MNVPEKHRAVAHAWVDGEEIEYRGQGGLGRWEANSFPAWTEGFEYRIKPKAKVKKWRWWGCATAGHYTEDEANRFDLGPKIDGTMIVVDE